MPKAGGLTDKQRIFADEYLIDLNAKQAAIRAGYKGKNAEHYGYELLHKSQVSNAVAQAMAERSKRTGIIADRVLQEIARIAFVDPMDVIDPETGAIRFDISKDDIATIAYFKIKTMPVGDAGEMVEREIRLCDKLKALDMLCKHLNLYSGEKSTGFGGSGANGADDDQATTGVVLLPAVTELPDEPPKKGCLPNSCKTGDGT